MGKGQVSEKELEQGIKSLGGLGGFAPGAARRDSPFGSDFVRKAQPIEHLPEKEVEIKLTDKAEALSNVAPKVQEEARAPVPSLPEAPQRKAKPPKLIVRASQEDEEGAKEASSGLEDVTVRMSSAMRDDLHFLATKLQRRRKTKEQRITSNTVIRVAVQLLLEELKLNETDYVNNEEELLALARRKVVR
jgi:hypothetical protein